MIKKIIKISAPWCAPCRAFAPIYDKVSSMDEFKDITFEKINTEDSTPEEQNFMAENNVRNIPTTLFFDENGKIQERIVGAVTESDFINKLREFNDSQEKTTTEE